MAKKLVGTRLRFSAADDLSDLLEEVPYFSRDRSATSPPPNYSHVEKFMKDAARRAVLKMYSKERGSSDTVSSGSMVTARSTMSLN